ncbi:MAG TPA: M23 family metallopeptidase [Spirochaetota bacterium]|nr:M23 family metallopeptidase [Spirochaetota bacterium]HPI88993.1 M23 family metallopeptidase [Spirochaetota bacterium]HPR47480.1 M23 family metallopeptidase [Spirochaetota bacterium]
MKFTNLLLLFTLIIVSGTAYTKSTVPEKTPEEKDSYHYIYNKELRIYHPVNYTPAPPEKKVFLLGDVDLYLYAQDFSQGRAVYAEIFNSGKAAERVVIEKLSFDGVDVPVTEREWGYRAVFAIPPEIVPGSKELVVQYLAGSREVKAATQVQIKSYKFPFSRYPMDLGKYSDVDYQEKPEIQEFIRQCTEKKRKAFDSSEADLLDESFAHPRDLHYVTSDFWAKRTIALFKWKNGKKIKLKNRVKVHRGLDLRGKKGKPVYSMANGRVALADTLYYEGNMVIIDHGNRVFSYYMHLDRMKVREGKKVKAGQLIGYVGETGISTAPHLHVSFMIRGEQVDPLSVLSLPLR